MAAAKGLVDTWLKDLKGYLHDDSHLISRLLGSVEQKLKIKREHIVYALILLYVAYLIFGNFASLVCNFAGFAYPAYVSMKAIESKTTRDDTQWLTYWSVFAMFSMIDPVADDLMGWFSIYWLAKFLFLVWLYLPSTRGAEKLYKMFLEPFMTKYSPQMDKVGQEIEEDFKNVAYEVRAEIHGLRERIDSLTHLALENNNSYRQSQNNSNRNNNDHQKYEEPAKEQPRRISQDSHDRSHENTNTKPANNHFNAEPLNNKVHAEEPSNNKVHAEEPSNNKVHAEEPLTPSGHKPAIVDHKKEPETPNVKPLTKENSNLNDEKRVSFHNDVVKK